MELTLDRHDGGSEFARFNKRLKYKDGRLMRIAAFNPILDISMYGVKYYDGYKTVMTASAITSILFSQVDQYGQRFYYSTPSYICVPTAHRSRRETLLSIYTMQTRGGERPPKDGEFP